MADQAQGNGNGQDQTPASRRERLSAIETARRALLGRPRLSLRFQIYLGFSLAFLFAVGATAGLVVTVYQVQDKIHFLEIVNGYVMEIEQARRFEKNYFLYGTNLGDALDSVMAAEGILESTSAGLKAILGEKGWSALLSNLRRYQGLLERLGELERRASAQDGGTKKELELEVRKTGQRTVSFATDLMAKERQALAAGLAASRRVALFSLIFLLVFMVFNAYLLGSRMLGGINRFIAYTRRIASGNYTPITPVRGFRDEFTELALGLNQMIADLENRESFLIQSHKMRAVGTLTAGVAHELNNPLNNITLTAHMLLEDYAELSDDGRREMITDVIKEAGRAKSIVVNLLDFARESGSQLEPLDLPVLVQETVALSHNQLRLKGIKIDFQATENLPRIHGDRQQLRQVFLNLILNAVDASSKGGKIQVLTLPADEPGYVAVKVIDHGLGIPAHILGSIFDPFFTTKPKGKGTGLGLSVSQGIIGKHGGRIYAASREGEGSTFTVTLPVTTLPAAIVS